MTRQAIDDGGWFYVDLWMVGNEHDPSETDAADAAATLER